MMLGRKIQVGDRKSYRNKGDRLDFLKSAGYQFTWQRETEGSIVTAYLPDLFRLDPGMVDPTGARFIILPPKAWSEKQAIDTAPIVAHALKIDELAYEEDELRKLVPLAFLFCAYLDRRTRCPLVSDGRFYLQAMLACLELGLASWSVKDRYAYNSRVLGVHPRFGFLENGIADVGLSPGVAFSSSHEQLEKTLAEQVKLFFSITRGR